MGERKLMRLRLSISRRDRAQKSRLDGTFRVVHTSRCRWRSSEILAKMVCVCYTDRPQISPVAFFRTTIFISRFVLAQAAALNKIIRSEERRVGKECR